MQCNNCGEYMIGNGYNDVIHCPYANDELVSCAEPDANPIHCTEADNETQETV
jgi:hypothetical protein